MPWPKGKPRSLETKLRISKSLNGRVFSDEHRKKLSLSLQGENNPMFGRTHSEEAKERMVKSQKGYWGSIQGIERKKEMSNERSGKNNSFYGREHTQESIQKMSNSHMGNIPWNKNKNGYSIHSEQQREQISKRMKGNTYALGYEHTEETKLKIGLASKGENNPNWRGGISYEPYGSEFNKELKRLIRERDGFVCQLCGVPEEDTALDVHHIDYDKKNNDPNNLIALCHGCHTRTSFNRLYWIEYFSL